MTQKQEKITIIVVLALVLVGMAQAALLPTSPYEQNFQDMVDDALGDPFNTTINFSYNGVTYLTVPEFNESTSCEEDYLQDAYNTSVTSWTHYEIRSDIFSEVAIVLSESDNPEQFDALYNTVLELDQCGYGTLPCWVMLRDGNNFVNPAGGNDTAIDGSTGVAMAMLQASNNPAFTSANRTKYRDHGLQMAADVLEYEFATITPILSRTGETVTMLPFGGGDCAGFGVACSKDMWVGYAPRIGKMFQLAYEISGNKSYDLAARNVTAAFLSVALQKDTDGDGFGVPPFDFNWDVTGSVLNHTDGGGVNSYHYNPSNPQWDDYDAPRFQGFCDMLRLANRESALDGVYLDLQTYCSAWANSATLTNTTSCLQYFYDGNCSTSIRTGYYENGLGAMVTTHVNTSLFQPKIDEAYTHYATGTGVYDGTDCGNALTYRGVRLPRAMISGLGIDTVTSMQPAQSSSNDACFGSSGSTGTVIAVIPIFIAAFLVFVVASLLDAGIIGASAVASLVFVIALLITFAGMFC